MRSVNFLSPLTLCENSNRRPLKEMATYKYSVLLFSLSLLFFFIFLTFLCSGNAFFAVATCETQTILGGCYDQAGIYRDQVPGYSATSVPDNLSCGPRFGHKSCKHDLEGGTGKEAYCHELVGMCGSTEFFQNGSTGTYDAPDVGIRCGPNHNNRSCNVGIVCSKYFSCDNGSFCSPYGWCGDTDAHKGAWGALYDNARCGPDYGSRVCEQGYCSSGGWCGTTDAHKGAWQGYFDAGRCGPDFNNRVCDCVGTSLYCSDSGWCGDTDAHFEQSEGRFDCPAMYN